MSLVNESGFSRW
jgi:hypothetical protein